MDRFLECVLFLVGLAFGSFLNVCISRIPRDESITAPPSHCPGCNAPIQWRDNIPLISWMVLRTRCRQCGMRIAARYPAVELLTAVLFLACVLAFGWSLLTLKFCVFSFLLIGLIFMDAETGFLPREFTYPGIALGLVFAWFAPVDYSGTELLCRLYGMNIKDARWLSLLDAAIAALIGAGFFYLAWALYYLVRRKHGLGFGDIALMALSGAFLGVKLTILVLFSAPILGVLYSVVLLLWEAVAPRKSEDGRLREKAQFFSREIPFGVFLGISSLAAIFVGEAVWHWYLRVV